MGVDLIISCVAKLSNSTKMAKNDDSAPKDHIYAQRICAYPGAQTGTITLT